MQSCIQAGSSHARNPSATLGFPGNRAVSPGRSVIVSKSARFHIRSIRGVPGRNLRPAHGLDLRPGGRAGVNRIPDCLSCPKMTVTPTPVSKPPRRSGGAPGTGRPAPGAEGPEPCDPHLLAVCQSLAAVDSYLKLDESALSQAQPFRPMGSPTKRTKPFATHV